MKKESRNIKLAGIFILIGMVAGIFSVAPSVDSQEYLSEASANSTQVIIASIFQLIMALSYISFAVLLYPILEKFSSSLAIGFLSFKITAAALVLLGTIVLTSILGLSQEYNKGALEGAENIYVLGNVLKNTRDTINHVFMVLVLCVGNFLFFMLLLIKKLIPRWISIWGLIGTLLSAVASMLLLFQLVAVITTEYLILNVPTAILELVLAFWLIARGFNRTPDYEENRHHEGKITHN